MRQGEWTTRIFRAAQHNHGRFFSADDYLKGLQYAEGRGVPQDPLEAYRWFDIAERKGHPGAAQQKAALTEAVERANMERWAASYFSVPEDELEKEAEYIGIIHQNLCRMFASNDWKKMTTVLRKTSQRFLGRELTPDRAYRHIRCSLPYARNIDLIRVTVEKRLKTRMAAELFVDYFVSVLEDPFLLGKLLMCRRDFGFGCMNVFEHIEKNLKDSEKDPHRTRALNNLELILRSTSRILTHDGEFCREYFLEEDTGGCQ